MNGIAILARLGASRKAVGADAPRLGVGAFILLLWTIWTAAMISHLGADIGAGKLLDTDDYMRLAQWRDFLAGQNWFDLSQHRFAGPEGGDIHFSRLPDAAMTVIYQLFLPFMDAAAAERMTLLVYPPILLTIFLAAAAMASRALAGRRAAFFMVAIIMATAVISFQFSPGRIDHHGLALCFLMIAFAGVVTAVERPSAAILAGLASTAAAAVSLETAPFAAAAAPSIALIWLTTGDGRSLRFYGLSLLAAAPIFLFAAKGVTLAPYHCDSYGAPAAAALMLAGVAATSMSFAGRAPAVARWTIAAGAAIVCGAILASVFPKCLGGPFEGMDPIVRQYWLSSVTEVQSPFGLIHTKPSLLIAYYIAPAIGLVIGAALCWRARGPNRLRWGAAVIHGAIAYGVFCIAIRGAFFAAAYAAFPVAALIAHKSVRVRLFPPERLAPFLALCIILSPYTYLSLSEAVAGWINPPATKKTADKTADCNLAGAARAMRQLPDSLLFNAIDLGPMILAQTPHSVTAAPYHRNSGSIRRTIDFYLAAPDDARAILAQSGARYVVICPTSGEASGYAAAAPEGMAARLIKGAIPDWLAPVALDGAAPLAIFRAADR